MLIGCIAQSAKRLNTHFTFHWKWLNCTVSVWPRWKWTVTWAHSLFPSPSLPYSLSLQLSADSRNYDRFPVRRNNRIQEGVGWGWNSSKESSSTVVTLCVCVSANVFTSRCANVRYFPLHFHKLHTLKDYAWNVDTCRNTNSTMISCHKLSLLSLAWQ